MRLTVQFERIDDRHGTVVAEFAPTEAGLHFYGIDLPRGGIEGAGRPTRLDLVDDRWQAAGGLSVSVEPRLRTMASFEEPFPIYPEGPVTLRQPVELPASGAPDPDISLEVTFMACRDGVCFAPVIDHPVTVRAP